jgi:hypothetical protein
VLGLRAVPTVGEWNEWPSRPIIVGNGSVADAVLTEIGLISLRLRDRSISTLLVFHPMFSIEYDHDVSRFIRRKANLLRRI